jgi:hypothetical protein
MTKVRPYSVNLTVPAKGQKDCRCSEQKRLMHCELPYFSVHTSGDHVVGPFACRPKSPLMRSPSVPIFRKRSLLFRIDRLCSERFLIKPSSSPSGSRTFVVADCRRNRISLLLIDRFGSPCRVFGTAAGSPGMPPAPKCHPRRLRPARRFRRNHASRSSARQSVRTPPCRGGCSLH